eukprot:1177141-Prorocentrum_minimum.AAC.1
MIIASVYYATPFVYVSNSELGHLGVSPAQTMYTLVHPDLKHSLKSVGAEIPPWASSTNNTKAAGGRSSQLSSAGGALCPVDRPDPGGPLLTTRPCCIPVCIPGAH